MEAFPTSVADEWKQLKLSGLDVEGRFSPNLGCFLVPWAGRLVLCDAGIGPGPNAYLGGLRGHLPEALASHGVTPDQIAAVVFTHLHMDHIGWATSLDSTGQRVASFPDADYFVAAPEMTFWATGATGARAHHREAFETIFRPLERLGHLVPVTHGEPILAGLSLISTPGHTPGHSSIRFEQGDQCMVVAGDIFHCPGQVERPDWHHRADMDPDQARITRKTFIKQAASEHWLIAAGHFRDGLQSGHISAKNDGFRFEPLNATANRKTTAIQQGRLQ